MKTSYLYSLVSIVTLYGLSSFTICGYMYLENVYSGRIKDMKDATVISCDTVFSSCTDCGGDPFVCFKPHLVLRIVDTQEMCSYVDDVSSTNSTLVLNYISQKMPLQSIQKVYKTDGTLDGLVNCNVASNHVLNKQEKIKKETRESGYVSIAGLIILCIEICVFVIWMRKQEIHTNVVEKEIPISHQKQNNYV